MCPVENALVGETELFLTLLILRKSRKDLSTLAHYGALLCPCYCWYYAYVDL